MIKYPVSKSKLYAELKRRGVKPAEAAKEMGFGETYLMNVAGRGEIPERGALYLERLYKIKPEDYAPDLLDALEVKSEKKNENDIPPAMYKAMAEAFAEAFREPIKNAVIEALKAVRV